MSGKAGAKGYKAEELIRRYFLEAGFFVLRGVPFQFEGDDLTDVDLWVYERSATLSRRRLIIDIKDKRAPQAAERMFFVKGLAAILKVEGAGVATSDKRLTLRELARRQNVLWIDGNDLQRFKSSEKLTRNDRLSEEQLVSQIASVDKARSSKNIKNLYDELRRVVLDRFGSSSANRALEIAKASGDLALKSHADSNAARASGRLFYLSVSVAAASFDFSLAEVALRPAGERVRYLTDQIRYGSDFLESQKKLKWSQAAISEFIENGQNVSQTLEERFVAALGRIPAEDLAEIIIRQGNDDKLFKFALAMERHAYALNIPSFDELDSSEKSIVGAMLDFVGLNRKSFADAWKYASDQKKNGVKVDDVSQVGSAAPKNDDTGRLL